MIRGAWRSMNYTLLLLAAFGSAWVLGSDMNWGKKVKCFVVEETVVCPGCNSRAGLTCPRSLKNSQNCLVSTTTPSPPKYRTKPPPDEDYEDEEDNSTLAIVVGDLNNFTTPNPHEIQKEPTKEPIDMAIFLYRLMGPWPPSNRYRRELQQQEDKEELETCNWNGDCPCPLICCKTGPGCPKRCVMGIRLPPPFG